MMSMSNPRRLLLLLLLASGSLAQDYQDYPQYDEYAGDYGGNDDNLYRDYVDHQESKVTGGGGGVSMTKLVLSSAVSWVLGAKFHSGRTARKLKTKFQKEQKQLYSQYYNDVYKLTEQNQMLQEMIEKLKQTLATTEKKYELENIQRDYDEFKQPDIDGDDRISRAEFHMYVKNYLANYPGLTEKDYPKFEDFDHDGDGYVSFEEYAQQMALVASKEQQKDGGSAKAQALGDMAASLNGYG